MKAPTFWWDKNSKWGRILDPFGRIYAWTVSRRFKKTKPYQSDVPVICVGNLSVGGTGKTPICLALGKLFQEKHIPFFYLNHGYKSKTNGILADTHRMTAVDIGDEAMLLSEQAPTVVDRNRARGAQLAVRQGAQALIMDDGFQHPGLIKTVSFIVVDGKKGFGNNRVMPAGPLREPIGVGLKRADAVIIVGEDKTNTTQTIRDLAPDIPILTGHFIPNSADIQPFIGQSVSAFAAIGHPEKFYDMLTEKGIRVCQKTSFPDHYFYTRFDIEGLVSAAGGLPLLTTAKDSVKIPKDLQSKINIITGEFVFDDVDAVLQILEGVFPDG